MEVRDMNKKQIIVVLIILAIIGAAVYYYKTQSNKDEYVLFEEAENGLENNQSESKIEEREKIVVHIAGAVANPGIVILEEGGRIVDAIGEAGGLLENANIDKINLAYMLEDGEKIYIPFHGEDVSENNDNVGFGDTVVKKDTQVNINTATQTELMSLPGIGASTAQKIVDYRKENGKFKSIEDIKNVSGIGDSKFNQIKNFIKVK
jgi:competence protein ComEA